MTVLTNVSADYSIKKDWRMDGLKSGFNKNMGKKWGALVLLLFFCTFVSVLSEKIAAKETGLKAVIINKFYDDITSEGAITDPVVTDPALIVNTVSVSGIRVHFIDVDHGCSTIVQCGDKVMVIDGGPMVKYNQQTESWTTKSIGERTKNYLNELGIIKLDYIIASHPHKDHIEGLIPVLNEFPTEKLIMPDVDYEKQSTTVYKKFLTAVTEREGLKVEYPEAGESFKLGDAKVTILAPNSENYSDINNYTIVLKIKYGSRTFIICGDCLKESEEEMINSGYGLAADVILVPHHGIAGEHTYSEDHFPFLKKLKPKYAVISKNMLASWKLLEQLRKTADVYCTYSSGTIVFDSDGESMDVSMDVGNEPDYYASDTFILTSRDKELGFIGVNEESNDFNCYKKDITLKFSGYYGIHSYQEIAWQKVASGSSMDVNGSWKVGKKVTLKNDFNGWFYVRYKNEKGQYIYTRTERIALDKTGIKNPAITSKKSESVKAVSVGKKNPKEPLVLKGKTKLNFSAVFGKSMEKEIAYQIVKDGKSYDKNGEWITGNSVTLKAGFKGNVYVRYTDGCGRNVYRKSNYIKVVKK